MAQKKRNSKATKTGTGDRDTVQKRAEEAGNAGEAAFSDAATSEFTSRNADVFAWSGLDPAQFGAMRRAFERGDYRSCLPVFERIMESDDRILAVSSKRYESVAALDYEIQLIDGVREDDPDAIAQRDVIRDFYNTLRVSSIMRRDMVQGVAALVSWLMTATAYGYAAATLSLAYARTAGGRDTVRGFVHTVPLRFFEAKTRTLRLRKNFFDSDGEPLDPRAWIICASPKPPLVVATMVLFLLKATPFEDWARAVEKFGTPFVYAKTPAKKGDKSWNDLVAAIRRVGSNFSGIFGKDVEITAQSVAQGDAPHEKLIDCINRSLAILWRGGDTSTESKSGDGAGSTVGGVSGQNAEREARSKSDRVMIEEALDAYVTRPVLETVFGLDVQPKVFFRFSPDNTAEVAANAEKIKTAKEIGLPLSAKWTYSALSIPAPAEGDEVVQYPAGAGAQAPQQQEQEEKPEQQPASFSNAAAAEKAKTPPKYELTDEEKEALGRAKKEEWKEILHALAILQQTPDEDFPKALKAFAESFPKFAGKTGSRLEIARKMNAIIDDRLHDLIEAEVKKQRGAKK